MIINSNRVRVVPYSPVSQSAKALAEALGGKRVRLNGSRYVPSDGDLVINWGRSADLPFDNVIGDYLLMNPPEYVQDMSNKLSFFEYFMDKDWLPRFWTRQEDIPDEDFPVVCRAKLNGHSGDGIVISPSRDFLVPAPLYVKYIKKKHEYRVHVGTYDDVNYHTISVQQKKRDLSNGNPNWQIRNHKNGFIYARQDVSPPSRVVECAVDCIASSGLDFGAVDVIWNEAEERAYVLEVNTAPGLQGSTLDDYVKFFKGELDEGQTFCRLVD